MSARPASQPESAASIAESIADYVRQITEERDLEAAVDFYTADCRILGPDMDMARDDVVQLLRSVLEDGIEVRVHRQSLELFVHGDEGYEIARAEDTLVNPDGSSNTLRNNLFIRWQRGPDGKWRFSRVLLSPVTIG